MAPAKVVSFRCIFRLGLRIGGVELEFALNCVGNRSPVLAFHFLGNDWGSVRQLMLLIGIPNFA